jgi:hypothetical protein
MEGGESGRRSINVPGSEMIMKRTLSAHSMRARSAAARVGKRLLASNT